jgi:hypothetical protein
MKIIGKLPPELGLYLGTESPVRLGRYGFDSGFSFGYGFSFGFGSGSGFGSTYNSSFGSGEGSKDIQYEDHR